MGFETFLGNEKAVSGVRGMLASGAVPGALLFVGPDGVGKKTLALMLAKALNCERLRDDFCGECRRCRKTEEMIRVSREDLARRREIKDSGRRVEGLVYFDVQLIEPITRFILIEQIRQLRVAAYTRPFELQRRVFILDQAQTAHWQAVDILLKVLEEPPETSHFILVCPNLHQLKATLRSRCHRVAFQPVADPVLEDILQKGKKLPAAHLKLATRIAAGSIASAGNLNLTEFQTRRQPWIDFLNGVTAKKLSSMMPGDWKAVFDSSKSLADSRSEIEAELRIGYSLLADILQILETGSDERVINLDLVSRLRAWAAKLGLEGINRLAAGLDSAYRLQNRNINQQLGWEALATELIARG
ncbi:MAG TPA: AAA family ATPase [Terriglobia bacterium]|nr:AAA family ATPase [Terriglobia bacterium]